MDRRCTSATFLERPQRQDTQFVRLSRQSRSREFLGDVVWTLREGNARFREARRPPVRRALRLAGSQFRRESESQAVLEKIGVDITVLLDPDMGTSKAWVKSGLPTTYIIDADQNIRYRVLGVMEWDAPQVEARIRKLLPK